MFVKILCIPLYKLVVGGARIPFPWEYLHRAGPDPVEYIYIIIIIAPRHIMPVSSPPKFAPSHVVIPANRSYTVYRLFICTTCANNYTWPVEYNARFLFGTVLIFVYRGVWRV